MRPLELVEAVPGPALTAALRAALDGSGPAVLPVSSDPAQRARVLAAIRPQEPVEDDVCLVVPTSGSTGEPRGVLLTADCLKASADAALERLGGPGRWWLALPVTHIGGLQVLLRSLAQGQEPALSIEPGLRYCSLVPTQLLRLLDDPRLTTFEAVLLGGAAAPPSLLANARARGINVVTTYGMSETSGGCVYDGSPLAGVNLAVGERIVLSGAVVARGYRFGEAFDGTFVTCDVGAMTDGRLQVFGRADDLIVTGGEKVAPQAVEAALSEHPAVAEVAVIGVPDPEWGARVVAVVVLRSPLSLEQARAFVAERVSRVAAPRELRVIEALPLLPGGKVDRRQLRSALT